MAEFEISFDSSLLKKILILGFLLTVFAFELNLTFNNPIAFGDEGFHVTAARFIGTEVDYSATTPLFGSDLVPERYTRPPLWNLIEASFYFLFGFNEGIVKFLVPFMAFMTGIVIYVFLSRMYSENLGIIAAAVAVTIPSYVTYSVLFYTTVPYVFFFSIAFMTLLAAIKTGDKKFWVLAGIFSGLSVLANIAGLFMIILTIGMGLFHIARTRNVHGIINGFKTYGVVLFIAVLIMSSWMVRNIALFATPECDNFYTMITGSCYGGDAYEIQTTNQFAGRTGGGGTEGSILNIGVANYLQFAYGFSNPNSLLNLIGLAFIPFSFLAGLIIVAKRKKISDIALVLSVLIFIVIFYQVGGLLDGRSEDTARYFLSAIPLIGILAGTYWASIRKEAHKINNIVILVVVIVILALAFTNFYGKLVQMESVKDFVPSFFEACDWVEENVPEGSNMLSFHTFPTRYNCDRPAVWEIPDKADIILSNDIDLVKERLGANGIEYIFVQKFSISQVAFGQSYPVSFVQFLENNNETFIKIYENGFPIQDCLAAGRGCDGNIIYRVIQ